MLGFQNIGMIGMFVFPGITGQVLHLSVEQTAHLYGMTFLVSGFVHRLSGAADPGNCRLCMGLMSQLHRAAGAGRAPRWRSRARLRLLRVACIIWFLLTVPIWGLEFRGAVRALSASSDDFGITVLLVMVQIASTSLPAWIGERASPGFPGINLLAGAVAVAVLVAFTLWGGKQFRRVAMLVGLVLGTIVYAMFIPISLSRVIRIALADAADFFLMAS